MAVAKKMSPAKKPVSSKQAMAVAAFLKKKPAMPVAAPAAAPAQTASPVTPDEEE